MKNIFRWDDFFNAIQGIYSLTSTFLLDQKDGS